MIEYEYEYEEEESLVSQYEEEPAAHVSQHEEENVNMPLLTEIGIQSNNPYEQLLYGQEAINNRILDLYGCENRLGWVQTMLIIILFCMAIFFYGRYNHIW